jgi:hypothetical protein
MGLDGGTIISRSDVIRGQSWRVNEADSSSRSTRGGQVRQAHLLRKLVGTLSSELSLLVAWPISVWLLIDLEKSSGRSKNKNACSDVTLWVLKTCSFSVHAFHHPLRLCDIHNCLRNCTVLQSSSIINQWQS